MAEKIPVPKLGMVQTDITVIELTRSDGDTVGKGEKVAVIETAKVAYDVHAPAPGMIYYLKRVKDKVAAGDILGVVVESREEFDGFMARHATAAAAPPPPPSQREEDDRGVSLSFEDDEPGRPAQSGRFEPPPEPPGSP
jgi:pyruvate/2-oxoglutarate dehydrogenase complex dihydrolipoamide acyltransferase (E2) component